MNAAVGVQGVIIPGLFFDWNKPDLKFASCGKNLTFSMKSHRQVCPVLAE